MGNKRWRPQHGYPLPCAKCGLKDYVEQPGLSNYICPNCYKKFYDMEEFIDHQKTHVPKERLMICAEPCAEPCSHKIPHPRDNCSTPCYYHKRICIPYSPQPEKWFDLTIADFYGKLERIADHKGTWCDKGNIFCQEGFCSACEIARR